MRLLPKKGLVANNKSTGQLKAPRSGKSRLKPERLEAEFANVASDVRCADAEAQSLKEKLAVKITELIDKKSWTQTEAWRRIGIDQPKLSLLSGGRLAGLSAGRLFAILNRLGHRVEVRISRLETAPGKSSHSRENRLVDQV